MVFRSYVDIFLFIRRPYTKRTRVYRMFVIPAICIMLLSVFIQISNLKLLEINAQHDRCSISISTGRSDHHDLIYILPSYPFKVIVCRLSSKE